MKVYDAIKKTEYDTVVALGFFDGVHLGHQKVIDTCVCTCDKNTRSVVFTFKESPHNTLCDTKKPLLTTNEQKFDLIEKSGVDEVFCVDFESVMNLSAQQFVKDILCDMLHAKCVVTGFNYRFSKGGAADADELARLCELYGIKAIKCERVLYKNDTISSTRIRQCIANGEIEDANAMLGYNFSVDTKVQNGNHIGTKINSPTINQHLHNQVIVPKFGVYATKVEVDGHCYIGATNIGVHPTVGECSPVCETHLLDFEDSNLYGEKPRTELVKFIRCEQKFDSIEGLISQIKKDVKQIKEYFKK